MKAEIVHFNPKETWGDAACGAQKHSFRIAITDDPNLTTCRRCLKTRVLKNKEPK